jgi:hypothetical protein
MKKITRALAVATAAGAALAIAPAANASYVAGCELNGTAHFDGSGLQGIPVTGPFSYSFDGQLTNCHSSNGGPGTGTVFAGEQGLNHATGSGGCDESVSNGEAVVKWADGKYTVIDYGTQGAAAAQTLTGTVASATSETTPVLDSSGNPTGATQPLFSTNEASTPVGSTAGGPLAFTVADPSQCNTYVQPGPAVTTATITGVIGEGQGPVALPATPPLPQLPQLPTPPIDIGPLQ